MALLTGPDRGDPLDDGVTPERRRQITLLSVWLLVAFDGVLTALTVGTWFYLRAADVQGMWRGLHCSPARPCTTAGGSPLPGPVPTAGLSHLAGVVVGAVLLGSLAWWSERSARSGASAPVVARRAAAATVVAVGTLGLVGVAYSGLVFNRFDGAYATAYWYVLVSCALHLGVIAVVLAGLTNRIRVGGDVPDGTSVRAVRILVVWTSVAVTILCLVASVGG